MNKLNDVSEYYQNWDRILPEAHTLVQPISKTLGKNISKSEKVKILMVSTSTKCDKYKREERQMKCSLYLAFWM